MTMLKSLHVAGQQLQFSDRTFLSKNLLLLCASPFNQYALANTTLLEEALPV